MTEAEPSWDAAAVRRWVESRIVAARADQVAAERYGRERQDDCDKAAAEEMICTAVRSERATAGQAGFIQLLKELQARDDFIWRGIYHDDRFDRHARSYIRKLIRMATARQGFANIRHHQ